MVFEYRPTEMNSLYDLLTWELYEDKARRHVADMLWVIASGRELNTNVYKSFSEQNENMFSSPFKQKPKQTGESIIDFILQR